MTSLAAGTLFRIRAQDDDSQLSSNADDDDAVISSNVCSSEEPESSRSIREDVNETEGAHDENHLGKDEEEEEREQQGGGEEQQEQGDEEQDEEGDEEGDEEQEERSQLLKGHFALSFLSCLAFVAAYESDGEHKLTHIYATSSALNNKLFQVFDALPANQSGRYYAIVVAGVSAVSNIITMALYCLTFCGLTLKCVRRGSPIECINLVFGSVWWVFGVAIITSIRGPAGDGRGQFNLYFSTWLCLFTNLSMFEMWLIEAKYSSIFQSIYSWPNRAPGWIMIFACTAASLVSILDLFSHHPHIQDVAPLIAKKYEMISPSQWSWLIFTCSISFTTAIGFSIVELFRRSDESHTNTGGKKGGCESKIEGICLAFLVIIWLPTIVVATTDNGAASDFGNIYFFTWGSAVVVIQTFITWLQDWRDGVHEASYQLRLEYERCKRRVNADNDVEGMAISGNMEDDNLINSRMGAEPGQ